MLLLPAFLLAWMFDVTSQQDSISPSPIEHILCADVACLRYWGNQYSSRCPSAVGHDLGSDLHPALAEFGDEGLAPGGSCFFGSVDSPSIIWSSL